MNHYPSSEDGSGLRFAVIVSRFNHLISARLLDGCTDALTSKGASTEQIDVVWVPGAFEIPLAARALADSGRYDALVTLGAVIRGGTPATIDRTASNSVRSRRAECCGLLLDCARVVYWDGTHIGIADG